MTPINKSEILERLEPHGPHCLRRPQGMSQYFFKVLNTQYQYSKKILLNTQYFNTFFHLKCIENTNTNINTQYFNLSDVILLKWFSCSIRDLYSLELTKDGFSCNNNCFSKFSFFKYPPLKAKNDFPWDKPQKKTRNTKDYNIKKYWVLVRVKWMHSIPILKFDKNFKSIENTNNQYHFESIENTNSIEYSYPGRPWLLLLCRL